MLFCECSGRMIKKNKITDNESKIQLLECKNCNSEGKVILNSTGSEKYQGSVIDPRE